MLIIRRAQMAAFEAAQLRVFGERLVRELVAKDATAAEVQAAPRAREERARSSVEAAVAMAARLGADLEASTRTLAELMHAHGIGFESKVPGWLAKGLNDPQLDGDDKVRLLKTAFEPRPRPSRRIKDTSDPELA